MLGNPGFDRGPRFEHLSSLSEHGGYLKSEVLEANTVESSLGRDLERLQRELLNSSLPSGPGFTAPNADTCSSSSSSYGSRRRHSIGTSGIGTVARRLGATGPAFSSNGLLSSPGSYSSTASGDVGGGGGDVVADDGRGPRRRRRPGGASGGGSGGGAGGERWTVAGGECWRDGERGDGGRGRGGGGDVLGESDDDDGLGPGLLSSPPQRTGRPTPRSRRWAEVRGMMIRTNGIDAETVTATSGRSSFGGFPRGPRCRCTSRRCLHPISGKTTELSLGR